MVDEAIGAAEVRRRGVGAPEVLQPDETGQDTEDIHGQRVHRGAERRSEPREGRGKDCHCRVAPTCEI